MAALSRGCKRSIASISVFLQFYLIVIGKKQIFEYRFRVLAFCHFLTTFHFPQVQLLLTCVQNDLQRNNCFNVGRSLFYGKEPKCVLFASTGSCLALA